VLSIIHKLLIAVFVGIVILYLTGRDMEALGTAEKIFRLLI
jgi:hypothetical protein